MERAIDTGYGWTKFTTGHARRSNEGIAVDVEAFQSVPMVVKGESIDLPASGETAGSSILVRLNGTAYRVSDQPTYSKDVIRIRGDGYTQSEPYAVCMAAAVKAMGLERLDHLVVGTPVGNYESAKASLKAKFGEGIDVDGRIIEVKHLHVVAQPIGGLVWHYYANSRQSDLSRHPRVLVDVGHGTLDWVAVQGLKTNLDRCGSVTYGVSRFIDRVTQAIKGSGQGIEDAWFSDTVDQMLMQNRPLIYRGQEHRRENFESLIEQIASEGVQHIMASLGDVGMFQSVVLMGGGGRLYQRALATAFKPIPIEEVAAARFANVRGFQLLAERQARMKS